MNFDFQNPEFLWLLVLLPLVAFLRGKTGKAGSLLFSSVAIAKSVSAKNKSRGRGIVVFLRLLCLALLITGLARPRLGRGFSEREESGIDIVLAVDVSYSMAALDLSESRDILKTRLDAAKEVVENFIKNRPNDRIGMVVFATNPFLVSPLTLNHDWLMQNIERVELGVIDGGSTAIGSAIGMSVNRLRDLKDAKSRVIILLTDGENNAGKISPIAAAEAAASYDAKIYTIAAGREGIVSMARISPRTGKVVRGGSGRIQVDGRRQQSRVDEETLEKIASITDGKFYRATDYSQLQNIYRQIDRLEKSAVKIRNYTEHEELFFWPLGAALVVLALERLLANTRFRTIP